MKKKIKQKTTNKLSLIVAKLVGGVVQGEATFDKRECLLIIKWVNDKDEILKKNNLIS